MKTQMRFQKYICFAMIIVGALATLYAFFYCSLSLSDLGKLIGPAGESFISDYVSKGKTDATLYNEIQPFNNALMYCGIVMILLSVLLYITACHSRRNYYVSNIVATSVCAGGNIVMSLVLLVMNGIWRGKFLNIDFEAWLYYKEYRLENYSEIVNYNDTTAMFDIGFVVYLLVIIASVLLILNLVWKIKLMQGEKQLLAGNQPAEVQAA